MWSRRDEILQLFQPRRSDPGHGVELLDGTERAVLLAIVEDLLRRHGPDAWEGVELLEGCAVQMHRARRAPGKCRSCPSAYRLPTPRDDDLLAVRDHGREIDELDLRLRCNPACLRERIGNSRTMR